MRPICILFVTIALLSANTSFAGEGDFQLRHSLKLTWAPTSLFDPWGSQVMLGAEYGFSNHFSLIGGAGIPLMFSSPFFTKKQISFSNDFKTRLELRCYINPEAKHCFFIGAEVFYRFQRYSLENSSYWFNINSYRYDRMSFSKATVSKDMRGGGILFGGSLQMSKRFCFEYYIGLGIKDANVTYSNVQNPYVSKDNKRYMDPSAGYNADFEREGEIVSPHVPVGLKLVYLLHRGKK